MFIFPSRQDSTDSAPRTRKLSSQELEQIIKLTQQEQMLHEQDMSAVSNNYHTETTTVDLAYCTSLIYYHLIVHVHRSDFFKKRSLFWSENFKNFVSGF